MTAITPTKRTNIQEFGDDGQSFLKALATEHLQLIDGTSKYYFTIPNCQFVSYKAIQKIIDATHFDRWRPHAVGKFANGDIKIRFCCGHYSCL